KDRRDYYYGNDSYLFPIMTFHEKPPELNRDLRPRFNHSAFMDELFYYFFHRKKKITYFAD
ncbi:MAG: hypothetical protein U9N73_04070, partial [Candidatus Auribacterota bacterium]|nr:hypothetical protein [Candidatus Auribacterota bacterium]